jgi:outer membrane protein OmpA-like peptidoglycan-associated protein
LFGDHMRARWIAILLLASLGGCSWLSGTQKYSVFFQPYSADLDQQAIQTVQSAADFARAHPLRLVRVAGFSAPPDPNRDVDGLSAQRADKVQQMLIDDGVRPEVITTAANGIVDPGSLPTVAVRRVDITIGK